MLQQTKLHRCFTELFSKLGLFVAPLFALVFLSGCVPVQQRPLHTVACNPQSIQQARYVVVNTARVPLGGHKIQVVGVLGNPQKVESFALHDGSMVEVMFYRTGEPGCPGMPTEDRYTPFVFQNGALLGYGNDYYRAFILPSLKNVAVPPQQFQPQQQQFQQHPQQFQPQPQAPHHNSHGSLAPGQPLWQ